MNTTTNLRPRMKHPVMVIPEAMQAIQNLGNIAHNSGVPLRTITMAELRASQINGCSVCVDMHSKELKRQGESVDRIYGIAAWRDNPKFDDAERAALALTEALTRIADQPDPITDEIWTEAARHYDEKALSALLLAICNINVWNRLNVAVKQVVGDWKA